MRHGVKKIKTQLGQDANTMLMRKLAVNFLVSGKLTTTHKRAKLLKTHLERLVEKTKEETESNKNYLLQSLADKRLVAKMFSSVGPVMKERVGGYVKVKKLYARDSDGALMTQVSWTVPVVMTDKVMEPKEQKPEPKQEVTVRKRGATKPATKTRSKK